VNEVVFVELLVKAVQLRWCEEIEKLWMRTFFYYCKRNGVPKAQLTLVRYSAPHTVMARCGGALQSMTLCEFR
jgi:hypothetical protein